jgi:citrate synthase
MVLLVDYELTSSALAARITASTGASLPACLLGGLATFSGPLHGDASGRDKALFDEVERQGEEQLIAHHLSTGFAKVRNALKEEVSGSRPPQGIL